MFEYLSNMLSTLSNSSSPSSSPWSSQSSSHTSCSSSGFYSSCSLSDNVYTDNKDWYQICDQYSSNFYTPSPLAVQAPFKLFPPRPDSDFQITPATFDHQGTTACCPLSFLSDDSSSSSGNTVSKPSYAPSERILIISYAKAEIRFLIVHVCIYVAC